MSTNETQPTTSSKKATVSNTPTKTSQTASTPVTAAVKKTSPARSSAAKTVEAPVKSALPIGFVSFVGSGPGDPELLTVSTAASAWTASRSRTPAAPR